AASKLAGEGQAIQAYDFEHLLQAIRSAVPRSDVHYHWQYPPPGFFLYWPLAWFAYPVAWCLYVITTTAMVVSVIRRIDGTRLTFWATLASPGLAFNSWGGQNGALNAAFMGIALLSMDRRPLVCAFSTALLACKPHLVPLMLLVQLMNVRQTFLFTLIALLG